MLGVAQVVYLTADSPHTLEVLDPTKAYVIGGLVDHNRLKNVCLNRAKEAGMATAKLPIQGNVNLSMSSVLTVNHMVEILVNFIARGNTASEWGPVLNEVLPMRKRAGGRATPESQTAQGDRGDKQQLGEQGQPGGQGQQQKSGEGWASDCSDPTAAAAAARITSRACATGGGRGAAREPAAAAATNFVRERAAVAEATTGA
eukprot:571647-Pelagomonas_calceolata.AAC.2